MLDSMTAAAAFVENGRLDALGANQLGRALYPAVFGQGREANWARYVFLDPQARDFHVDWERAAKDCVALLRSEAGRNPTTGSSPTSSASSPPAATSSAPCGPPTTSGCTSSASSGSTTRSSASSN